MLDTILKRKIEIEKKLLFFKNRYLKICFDIKFRCDSNSSCEMEK